MKKIALDISQKKVRGTGIGNYTKYLQGGLIEIKSNVEYIDIPVINSKDIFNKIYVYIWEQVALPFYLLFKRIGVFHRTANMGIPFLKFSKYIITVHDIIPILFEKEYLKNPLKHIAYKVRMKWTVYAADKIIVDSHCTRNDLIMYFNAKEENVEVIYLGVDKKYKKLDSFDSVNEIKHKFSITKPYILGIGGNEPRKNVKTLIKAFQEYKSKYNMDCFLVIIGKPWLGYSDDSVTYENSNNIVYTGYVEDKELVSLYNGAEIFVFPSLYEGFGLPALEAMACGTPVIASNCSSIPEITGDAALLVDPLDIAGISETMMKVLSDSSLKNTLISKGYERVKLFNWTRTANETYEVYKNL